jgi:hypothetical protein
VVKILLKHKLDAFQEDINGWTPFFYAIYREKVDVVLLLLSENPGAEAEADVSITSSSSSSSSRSTYDDKKDFKRIGRAFQHFRLLGNLFKNGSGETKQLRKVLRSLATVPDFFNIINDVLDLYWLQSSKDNSSSSSSLEFIESYPYLLNASNKLKLAASIAYQNTQDTFPIFHSSYANCHIKLSRGSPWKEWVNIIGSKYISPLSISYFDVQDFSQLHTLNSTQLKRIQYLFRSYILLQFNGAGESGHGVGVEREVRT